MNDFLSLASKTETMNEQVLKEYGLDKVKTRIEPHGKGLINNTWKLIVGDRAFILQRINESVFKTPTDIASNIKVIDEFLFSNHPDYCFISPIETIWGKQMLYVQGEGYFRLFQFVKDSHTIDVVETPEQAYEAAAQFAKFTRALTGINVQQLRITIPGFHDLAMRYKQFHEALQQGNKERLARAADLINIIKLNEGIIDTYNQIINDPSFHLRVTHHDTKISNVLFDKNNKGICVIDLDTVMPGYFISDVGDMMRTYLSPVSEEEKDLNKICVREDFYKAIVRGYFSEMKGELTEKETKMFFYSGQFMIYMQALRFLTDYLNNDIYYGAKYPDHNFVRAANQLKLLERLNEKQSFFANI